MYPLLPIVSSIVVGDKKAGKGRAFTLSMVYVQGLALTYTLVGVIARLGKNGHTIGNRARVPIRFPSRNGSRRHETLPPNSAGCLSPNG